MRTQIQGTYREDRNPAAQRRDALALLLARAVEETAVLELLLRKAQELKSRLDGQARRMGVDAEEAYGACLVRLWKSFPKYKDMGRPEGWIVTTHLLTCLRLQDDAWARRHELAGPDLTQSWPEPSRENDDGLDESVSGDVGDLKDWLRARYPHFDQALVRAAEQDETLGPMTALERKHLSRGRSTALYFLVARFIAREKLPVSPERFLEAMALVPGAQAGDGVAKQRLQDAMERDEGTRRLVADGWIPRFLRLYSGRVLRQEEPNHEQ